MAADLPATAEGNLERTPTAHLLVYAVDQRLTGEFVFLEPSGIEHVVMLSDGAPVKIRSTDRYARLGEMLIEAGAIDEATLRDALATQGLLGDVLLLAGRVEHDVLERVATEQFVRRMVRLFGLPPQTTFRYYNGRASLRNGADPPSRVDPLAILWAGLRQHGAARSLIQSALSMIDEPRVRLHPRATIERLSLGEDEVRAIEIIKSCHDPLHSLRFSGLLSEEELGRLAYALMITRQIEIGANTTPVGVSDGIRDAKAPSSGVALARLRLRSASYREGAAAPDPPGDGERRSSVPGEEARASSSRGESSQPPFPGRDSA